MVMATDTSAELAEALGAPAEELVALRTADGAGVDGLGLTYQVSDADKEAWRPAWRLEVGYDGIEYGKPMKLPKNVNALANYLSKRRKDGGRLFTLAMPERIAPRGEFVCFVVPEVCDKHAPTKGLLIDHMEGCHPKESAHHAPLIKQLRDSIAAENPALQQIVDKYTSMPDRASVVVPEDIREQHNVSVPVIPMDQTVTTFSVTYDCQVTNCGWKPDAGKANPKGALRMHTFHKHKEM